MDKSFERKIYSLIGEVTYYKHNFIGKKFEDGPMSYFDCITAEYDDSTTDLYFCTTEYDDAVCISRYNVEACPLSDVIVAINLEDVDFVINGQLYQCINITNVDAVKKFIREVERMESPIMNSTNGHNEKLVELINKAWAEKLHDEFKPIMKALYYRDYDECIDKFIFDGNEEMWLEDWHWEDAIYDYLMEVADDTDLITILHFLRVPEVFDIEKSK